MTEPPEPRRPEEGGGEEPSWEQDSLAELDDDITLDMLGGDDGIPFGENTELTDMLGAWRDDVESVPLPPGTSPEVVQQIHDFSQEIERGAMPPHTQEGSAAPVSAQEEAARLNEIGSSEDLLGLAQKLIEDLTAANQSVAEALGPGHTKLADAQGPFEQAIQGANELSTTIAAALGNLRGIAQQLG